MKQYAVTVVGSSQLFWEGLQFVFKKSRFNLLERSTTFWAAVSEQTETRPDVVVCLCAASEDAIRLVAQMRERQFDIGTCRVVVLAGPLSPDLLRAAAACGVQAVLSKDISSEVLLKSLELVMLGQQLYPGVAGDQPSGPAGSLVPFSRPGAAPEADGAPQRPDPGNAVPSGPQTRALQIAAPPARYLMRIPAAADVSVQRVTTLSQRERQILRCLVTGAANKTIARELDITEATVKVHIKGLLRKIRVNNRTQAAVWGMNNNFDDDEHGDPAQEIELNGTVPYCQIAS